MCVSRMQRTLVSGRLVASSPIRGVGLCLSGHDVVADATYRTSYSAMSRQGQLAGHAMQRDAMRSLRIARAQAGSTLECVPALVLLILIQDATLFATLLRSPACH